MSLRLHLDTLRYAKSTYSELLLESFALKWTMVTHYLGNKFNTTLIC